LGLEVREKSALKARENSIPHVSFIELNLIRSQKRPEFLLKRNTFMMLLLVPDILAGHPQELAARSGGSIRTEGNGIFEELLHGGFRFLAHVKPAPAGGTLPAALHRPKGPKETAQG
jgi:hypothetical protein